MPVGNFIHSKTCRLRPPKISECTGWDLMLTTPSQIEENTQYWKYWVSKRWYKCPVVSLSPQSSQLSEDSDCSLLVLLPIPSHSIARTILKKPQKWWYDRKSFRTAKRSVGKPFSFFMFLSYSIYRQTFVWKNYVKVLISLNCQKCFAFQTKSVKSYHHLLFPYFFCASLWFFFQPNIFLLLLIKLLSICGWTLWT